MKHYETLGVSQDANQETIRAAFRRLAAKFHPDRFGGDPAAMAGVNEAYRVLGDPVLRKAYDEGRDTSANDVDPRQAKVRAMVLDLYKHCLSQGRSERALPYIIRQEAESIIGQMKKTLQEHEKEAKRQTSLAEKLETSEGENFLRDAALTMASQAESQALNVREALELAEEILAHIKLAKHSECKQTYEQWKDSGQDKDRELQDMFFRAMTNIRGF